MSHPRLVLALLPALLLAALPSAPAARPAADPPPVTVRTPTGTHIPLALLRELLPRHAHARPHAHLFDLAADGTLHGPARFALRPYDLARAAAHPAHPAFTLTVNGQPVHAHLRDLQPVIRRGRGYTAVVAARDGALLALWGNGLRLRPLHSRLFPRTFANVAVLREGQASAPGDDAVMADSSYKEPPIVISVPGSPNDASDDAASSKTGGKAESTRQITDSIPIPGSPDTPLMFNSSTSRQSSSCKKGNIHYLEIAIAFDNKYCNAFGDNYVMAVASVHGLLAEANEPYRRGTCVRLSLVHVDAHCANPKDPYAHIDNFSNIAPYSDNSAAVLARFRIAWQASRANIRRDVAFLLSGFEDKSDIAGRAYQPGTCPNEWAYAYGWVEGQDAYVLAHEIGHSLSCPHVSTGLMQEAIDRSSFFFSAQSIKCISSFVDTDSRSRCMQQKKPACDTTCDYSCVNGECQLPKTVPSGYVPCTPIRGFYYCAELRTFAGSANYYFSGDCPSGYNFVRRSFDARDRTVFCCAAGGGQRSAMLARRSGSLNKLQVNYGDGSTRYVPGLIYPSSRVSQAVLLQSTRVRKCQDVVEEPPPSDPKPPPPPQRPQPRPDPNPVPSPSRSPTPSPSPATKQRRTRGVCGDKFSQQAHLTCEEGKRESIMLPNIGRVYVGIVTRYGKFRLAVTAWNARKIVRFGALVSEDSNVAQSVLQARSYVPEGEPSRAVWFSTPVNKFPLPRNPAFSSCCGAPYYAYAYAKICRRVASKQCAVMFSRVMLPLPCRKMCTLDSRTWVGLPMTPARLCPGCLRRKL